MFHFIPEKAARSGWRLAPAYLAAGCGVCFAQGGFQSSALWHRLLKEPIEGTITYDHDAVEFRSRRLSHRWLYGEIKTFELSGARNLTITDYENRHWHEPGERRFRFTLSKPVPAAAAAELAARVARPVINGDPESRSDCFAELPAHRRERFGGSNGELRFRNEGIDYIASGSGGRSWRWSDIQTLASPDIWDFRVTAYREIVEFDLKQPMPRELFDKLWGLLSTATEGERR